MNDTEQASDTQSKIPSTPSQSLVSADPNVVVPPLLRRLLYGVFMWCLLGIAAAHGMRLWNDSPVHPSFLPFVGIAFAAILSFTVVMVFRSMAGELQFEFGTMKFKGASGPIVFWAICFLTVCAGASFLGITDAVKKDPSVDYSSCGALAVALGKCEPKLRNSALGKEVLEKKGN